MKTYIVYKATCSETKKSYIGYTNSNKGFERRKYEHYNNAFNNCRSKFYNALRKYPEKFEWEILEESIKTKDEVKKREIYFISEFDSYKNGYNSTKGGDGGDLSEYRGDHKKKIEESIKNDIIEMYVSGIGKAEIKRKYPDMSITLITSILKRNGIKELPPLNKRNKKEKTKKPLHQSYTGNKNGRYIPIEESIKLEAIRLYTSREMTKKQICSHFNIGGRVLDRIFREYNVQKNKPIFC
jgi:group I intron endonuclease